MQANYQDMNLDQLLNAAIHEAPGSNSKELTLALHLKMKGRKKEILAYKGTPMALLNSHAKNIRS